MIAKKYIDGKRNFKQINKKATYDFVDMIIFLLFSFAIFSVIIFSISLDQPKFYPNLNADSFVTMLTYSDNSIFSKSLELDQSYINIVKLDDLKTLDSKYYGNKINDFVAARLYVIDSDMKKVSDFYYYNKDFYELWDKANQLSVSKFRYNYIINYYDSDQKSELKEGVLVIEVYANHQKPFSQEV